MLQVVSTIKLENASLGFSYTFRPNMSGTVSYIVHVDGRPSHETTYKHAEVFPMIRALLATGGAKLVK